MSTINSPTDWSFRNRVKLIPGEPLFPRNCFTRIGSIVVVAGCEGIGIVFDVPWTMRVRETRRKWGRAPARGGASGASPPPRGVSRSSTAATELCAEHFYADAVTASPCRALQGGKGTPLPSLFSSKDRERCPGRPSIGDAADAGAVDDGVGGSTDPLGGSQQAIATSSPSSPINRRSSSSYP